MSLSDFGGLLRAGKGCLPLLPTIPQRAQADLISHGGHLLFMPVLLGVLGGAAAFGFVGILLGPTLLAVGYRLVNEWVDEEVSGEGKAEKP